MSQRGETVPLYWMWKILYQQGCFSDPFTVAHRQKTIDHSKDCRINYITLQRLKVNLRIHTGERPFACPQCSKCFRCQSELATHNRIHTGERPYKCVACDKRFYLSNNLKIHLRSHKTTKQAKASTEWSFQCGKYTCPALICGTLFVPTVSSPLSLQGLHTEDPATLCPHPLHTDGTLGLHIWILNHIVYSCLKVVQFSVIAVLFNKECHILLSYRHMNIFCIPCEIYSQTLQVNFECRWIK